MNYTTKQSEDILTLCNNYAQMHSNEKNKEGCYIIIESSYRKVASKGCNNENTGAVEDAVKKLTENQKQDIKGGTIFCTKWNDAIIEVIKGLGISLIVFGGTSMPSDKSSNNLKNIGIETVHLKEWKSNV